MTNLEEIERKKKEDFLITEAEGKKINLAKLHPITQIIEDIYQFFTLLGYQIIESSEIEDELHNFDKLNIPIDHPSRDYKDTFYLNKGSLLLRTHTSNSQVHSLLKNSPEQKELKVVSIGKVYRRDEDDATHTHQFTQLEFFAVGKNISFANLKNIVEKFLKFVFGEEQEIRFRPSYFPFTEPSVEIDAKCPLCSGQGCGVCKESGWVEILGAGLIHPKVISNCGYNSQKFSGFAAGVGIERLLMIKHGIEDIRKFYLNEKRFLEQF